MGRAKNFSRIGCEADFCHCTHFLVFSDSPYILFFFIFPFFTPTYLCHCRSVGYNKVWRGNVAQTTLINALFSRKTQNTAGHTPRYTCECTEQFQPANVKKEPKRQLQLCMLKNNKLKVRPLYIQRQWVLSFIVEYV